MVDIQLGDIWINNKPYRVLPGTKRKQDVTDFSPRSSTPGGSIIHSELGLYQPLLQTSWQHGMGFPWYEDAQGYMRTDGNIDTRHKGIAMLFTAAVASETNANSKEGFTVWNGRLWSWGNGGLRSFDGTNWQSEYSGAVAVGLGVASKSKGNGVSSLTFSANVPDADQRALVVTIHLKSAVTINSVTFNGDAMTSHASLGTTGRVAIYKLIAPDVGLHDVVITLSTISDIVATAIPLTNVDQTTPLDAAETNTGTGTSSSKAVTSAALNKVIDAITINSAGAGLVVGAGANILLNPSFETGAITNWTLGAGWSSVSVSPHKGTKSAKLSTTSATYVALTSDQFAVAAETGYLFYLWARLTQLSPGLTYKVEIKWYDSGATLLRTDVVKEESPLATFAYKKLKGTYTSPEDAATAEVVVSGKVTSGTSIMYFDDGDFELSDTMQVLLGTDVQDTLAGASSYKPGAASVTMAWEWTASAAFNHLAADVNPGSSTKVNFALALGDYLFYAPDGARLRKVDKAGVHSDAGVNASSTDYLSMVAHNGYVYALKDGTNIVYYGSADDLSDLFGAPADDTNEIYIGPGSVPVIGHVQAFSRLFWRREDGLWELGEDRIARRVLNYGNERSSTNFRSAAEHNGFLVYAVRDQLFQWNGLRQTPITPPRLTDTFPYKTVGRFDNFVVVGDYFYMTARTNETTYTESLWCFDGVGWHKLLDLITDGDGSVTAMGYDTVNERMWLHIAKAASHSTQYIQFQAQSEFPYGNFPTTGTHSLISSRLDMGFRRVIKSTPSMWVEASNLTSTRYLSIYYSLDGGAWVFWDNITADGVTELDEPGGEETREYNYLLVRVDFATADATQSPILESFTIRFLMRPDEGYGYSYDIILGGAAYEGQDYMRTAGEMDEELEAARASKAPVEFTDHLGRVRHGYLSAYQTRDIEENLVTYDNLKNVESVGHVSIVVTKNE